MKLRHLFGGLVLALVSALAGAASLVVLPQQLVVDVNGDVRSGAKLFVYAPGTTTPRTAYTTPALSTPHASPVLSVSTGLFPAIYTDQDDGAYKLVLKDSADVTIWTEDNIPAANSAALIGQTLYPRSAEEITAGITPTNYVYPVGNVKRYGAVGDDSTNDSTAVQDAFDVAAVAGGEVYVPAGTYKIVTQLVIDGNPVGANFGLRLHGESRRTARLKSYVASGELLWIGNASGSPQNGVTIRELGFDSDTASGENALLRCDYCLDGRIENNLFNGGEDTQLQLGRAQNVTVLNNEFRGDSTRTQYGIVITTANANAGQGAKIIRNTIREFRTGDGVGIWTQSTGGGEHSILSNMIEVNLIGVRLEGSRHLVFDNSFENTEATDTQVKVGVAAGTRAQHHVIQSNTFSADSDSNFKCIDLVLYGDILINNNRFFNTAGTNVYFGADENNVPSFLTNNELPMSAVSFGGTEGKVVVYGNTANGTQNPRTTATSLDATPTVANFDILATANGGATSITDFDDGHPGKLLMVMVEDANTTIVNGTPIKTLSGANIAAASGDIFFFQASVGSAATDTPVWRQIGGLHATQTIAAGAGNFTVKSANANAGNTTGWYQVAPGIYVPYTTDPTP